MRAHYERICEHAGELRWYEDGKGYARRSNGKRDAYFLYATVIVDKQTAELRGFISCGRHSKAVWRAGAEELKLHGFRFMRRETAGGRIVELEL